MAFFSKFIRTGALASGLVTAVASADVQYQLAIDGGHHHLGDVTAQFDDIQGPFFDVQLPDWRTGRYEILNLANGVRFFTAKNAKGTPLNAFKVDKNTWRIEVGSEDAVTVSYQVYANELGLRARHIDDSHAFIDASGFFVFNEAHRHEPVTVSLDVPKGWRSVSGMDNHTGPHSFQAANYDVLVDSPIETGINEHHTFTVDGREYELVIWGEGNYSVETMLTDLKKLVKTGTTIWHDYPYQRYVFMVHATSGARGATEHLNSTIIQRKRDTFASRKDYLGFIGTASHEFVHTWNVKAYRPQGLVPYDYVNENYSRLLWLAEGSTSYLEDYLLLRADIMTTKEFFSQLTRTVNRHLKTPGRDVQSAAHTSFDKWINQGGDHGRNFSTNIYLEGALISLALDIDLLRHSNGAVSYKDVHRELYKRHALPKGFTVADVKAILKNISGRDYESWWQANVDSPAKLDFDDLFAQVGLIFERPEDAKVTASLDVSAQKQGDVWQLRHVRRDGAAWQAGLTAGDTLVAINGRKVTKDLADTLSAYEPGETVTVHYFRRDGLAQTTVTLGKAFDKDKVIKAVKAPSASQAALFKAWTGVAHPHSEEEQ